MTEHLELVLHKYDLELTIDEKTELVDLITYYCDSNQEWMSSSEDGIKEHKIADQILNLPFSSHHTETITFILDQIYCINHALNQKEELWSGDNEGFKLGIVDKEGHLIGVLGDIDKKIEEVI